MWILVILQLIVLTTLALLFIIGPILMVAGKCKRKKNYVQLGFKMFLVPFSVVTLILIHHLIWKLAIKPSKKDLIGHYQLTDSSAAANGDGTLRLYENGTFEKSFLSNHGLCEKGKYKVYEDEVWFQCDTRASVAKIDKDFFDFKLKFIIGTNRNNEADIVFKKVKD